MDSQLKIAVIGCGQIAAAHLGELALIKEATTVAVCDIVRALAEDTAARFTVPSWYTDHAKMLAEVKPDVVHILVPPVLQKQIALDAIADGCSIYVEKPFCVNQQETLEVIEAAKKQNVLACAGFQQRYDNASQRLRDFIAGGKLGDVVHVESYYGDSAEGSFFKLFLRNKDHWIHRLPGKLFQNVVSHALAQVAPYLDYPLDEVKCISLDRSKNGVMEDELRVIILSGNVTGHITFTSSARPITQYVKIHGTKAIATLDLSNHSFYYLDETSLPGPIARIRNSLALAGQLIREGFSNSTGFISGNDRFFFGMGELFKQLYAAIRSGNPDPPVPYKEVLIVAEILDRIGEHCVAKTHSKEY